MVRSELVARLLKLNPHLYEREAEGVVDAILGRITEALADGDRVELRGFGAFAVRHQDARPGRNPRNGTAVKVEAKTKIHFRPGKPMQAMLNSPTLEARAQAEPQGSPGQPPLNRDAQRSAVHRIQP